MKLVLELADDVALLSEPHKHMQQKTERLQGESSQLGLKINVKPSKAHHAFVKLVMPPDPAPSVALFPTIH